MKTLFLVQRVGVIAALTATAAGTCPVWSAPPSATSAPQPATGSSQITAKAQASPDVLAAQQNLDRTSAAIRAGITPSSDMPAAIIALAAARISAATEAGTDDGVATNLETIAGQRKLQAANFDAGFRQGVRSGAEINQARSAVAVALARVQLFQLVLLKKEALAQADRFVRAGISTVKQRDAAAEDVRKARLIFDQLSD